MTEATEAQRTAIIKLGEIVVEAVAVAGDAGAPGGTVYAALMTVGVSYDQFDGFMAALVQAGRLKKRGDLYFAV